MLKQTVSTTQAAPPGGPYSQAVIAGDFVYLSGATPTRPDGTRVEGDFREQARATFENLRIVAEAAGSSLADAVRLGVYLRHFSDFAELNDVFEQYFPDHPPARTTLQVDLPDIAIEVDAVLIRRQRRNAGGSA